MLGRLLTGVGMMRAGQLLVRRGQAMRQKIREAPALAAKQHADAEKVRRKALIMGVREKTRGLANVKRNDLFSKRTGSGRARRSAAAQAMLARRAGLQPGQTFRGLQQARSRQIVKNVKSVTRSIHPANQLSKKTPSGRYTRQMLAQHLRDARKAPTQWGLNGPTHYLYRQRKYQL